MLRGQGITPPLPWYKCMMVDWRQWSQVSYLVHVCLPWVQPDLVDHDLLVQKTGIVWVWFRKWSLGKKLFWIKKPECPDRGVLIKICLKLNPEWPWGCLRDPAVKQGWPAYQVEKGVHGDVCYYADDTTISTSDTDPARLKQNHEKTHLLVISPKNCQDSYTNSHHQTNLLWKIIGLLDQ